MDPVLRAYGVLVSGVVALTALRWLTGGIETVVAAGTDAICWPFFDDCRSLRVLGPGAVVAVSWGLLVGGLATAALFRHARTVPVAWWSLAVLTLVKTALILLDYRMRLNQHLMAGGVTFAFLLLPSKRPTVKLLVALYYFWAGMLKLTPEWLSGAALYRKPWLFDGPLLQAGTAYVLVLELVLAWGLFSTRRAVAWAVLAQLGVFHLLSLPVVGFFYPLLMAMLVAIFPLEWKLDPAPAPRVVARTPLLVAAVFSLLQACPKAIPGDTALTGEGRLLTLHMFDALPTCEVTATLKLPSGRRIATNAALDLPPRIRCDPAVYLSVARDLCRRHGHGKRAFDLDLLLRSKRSTDGPLRTIVDVTDFCARAPRYSVFGWNDWIRRE